MLLGATCLLQFAFSKWLDSRYEPGLGRNYYWMIWYPLVFWIINTGATVVAYPQVFTGPARPAGPLDKPGPRRAPEGRPAQAEEEGQGRGDGPWLRN